MAVIAPVAPPAVSPLPIPPTSADPASFDARADNFLGSLPTNQTEMNSLGSNVYDNAQKTYDSATQVVNSIDTAVTAATTATSAANTATDALTEMQKLYLGSKTTPPTTNNQGGALVVGSWYTNAVQGYWYWWDGSAWKLGVSDLSIVDWQTQIVNTPTTLPGYGITDLTQARMDLGLKSAAMADIVGTVSQSGGVPTGALIQRGSNANGEFVRFADGTQICTVYIVQSPRTVTSEPASFGSWVFPAAFSAIPFAIARHVGGNAPYVRCDIEGVTATYAIAIWVTTYAVGSNTITPTICMLAIGRWF